MQYQDIHTMAAAVAANVGKVIVGREEVITHLLASLLAGGHVLLEDVPGTGKTTLARSLAASLDCSFNRIQFTADLLPSDITGLRIYEQHSGHFRFEKGPVFTNILLADEINRATPRTQSALLECMEEHTVTEAGETMRLPVPFLVIATQNPVETQGTFPLPEAQLDRFLMRLSMGLPDSTESLQMLRRFEKAQPLQQLTSVADGSQLEEAGALCANCHISDDLMAYIVALCEAARNPEQVRLGPSPRAMLALMRCSRALAAIRGRDYVIPDDVKELAVPVLAHRVILRGVRSEGADRAFIESVLAKTPVPTEARV